MSSDPPPDPLGNAGTGPSVRAPIPFDASTHSGSAWKRESNPPLSSEPPARYEHFEILRREDGSLWRLGRGAMEATYKALDTRLQHHVALKDHRLALAVLTCDANALSNLLANTARRRSIVWFDFRYPPAYFQVLTARMRGDRAAEQIAFTEASTAVENDLLANEDNGFTLSLLAVINAQLGHAEEALRESKRACELNPFAKSSTDAATVVSDLIVVCA